MYGADFRDDCGTDGMSLRGYGSYRDSRLSWLCDIPGHWGVIQSRRIFVATGQFEGERQLTVSQKYGVILQDEFAALDRQRVVQVITGADILKHVEPDDFVISMRSFRPRLVP